MLKTVIPAKAGIQKIYSRPTWMPAFAGMTEKNPDPSNSYQKENMPKYNITRRLVVPVAIVFFTMVISLWIYSQSWKIENDTLNNSIAFISGIILFASIGFGACVIYPIIFFRGGSIGERIFASLFTPVVWNIKEMIRVSEFFTFGETLNYGLNSVFVLLSN